MNNIEAATSYGALTLLIKPFFQEPKYLKEADVMAIKDSQDRLLLALSLPREVSLRLATTIFSHQTPETPQDARKSPAN